MKIFWWAMVGVIFKEKVVYGCVNSVLTGSWLVTHYSRCEKVVLYQSIVCCIDGPLRIWGASCDCSRQKCKYIWEIISCLVSHWDIL